MAEVDGSTLGHGRESWNAVSSLKKTELYSAGLVFKTEAVEMLSAAGLRLAGALNNDSKEDDHTRARRAAQAQRAKDELSYKQKVNHEPHDGGHFFRTNTNHNDGAPVTRAWALLAVRRQGTLLRFLPSKMRHDRQIVLEAVKSDGYALRFASHELKSDLEIVHCAVERTGFALYDAQTEIRNDRSIVLAAVDHYGLSLRHASKALSEDLEVVLAAVRSHGLALEFASAALKAHPEVVSTALQQTGFALQHVAPELQHDHLVVLTAVERHGEALRFAGPKLCGDREIVLAAVTEKFNVDERKGNALQYASEELKDDKSIVLAAIQANRDAIEHCSERLFHDEEVQQACLSKDTVTRETERIAAAGELLLKQRAEETERIEQAAAPENGLSGGAALDGGKGSDKGSKRKQTVIAKLRSRLSGRSRSRSRRRGKGELAKDRFAKQDPDSKMQAEEQTKMMAYAKEKSQMLKAAQDIKAFRDEVPDYDSFSDVTSNSSKAVEGGLRGRLRGLKSWKSNASKSTSPWSKHAARRSAGPPPASADKLLAIIDKEKSRVEDSSRTGTGGIHDITAKVAGALKKADHQITNLLGGQGIEAHEHAAPRFGSKTDSLEEVIPQISRGSAASQGSSGAIYMP